MAAPADHTPSAAQDQGVTVTEPRVKQELTDYERGYLDGMLAYSYRSGGEVYVGRNRLTTYRNAVKSFLSKRGLHGWDVNVH